MFLIRAEAVKQSEEDKAKDVQKFIAYLDVGDGEEKPFHCQSVPSGLHVEGYDSPRLWQGWEFGSDMEKYFSVYMRGRARVLSAMAKWRKGEIDLPYQVGDFLDPNKFGQMSHLQEKLYILSRDFVKTTFFGSTFCCGVLRHFGREEKFEDLDEALGILGRWIDTWEDPRRS